MRRDRGVGDILDGPSGSSVVLEHENTDRIVMRNTAELARYFVAGSRRAGIIRARIDYIPITPRTSVEANSRAQTELVSTKPIASGNRQSSEISFREARISVEATFRRRADVTILRGQFLHNFHRDSVTPLIPHLRLSQSYFRIRHFR